MIRRPPRSTQSRSSAASDVYKRQAQEDEEEERPGDRQVLLAVMRNILLDDIAQKVHEDLEHVLRGAGCVLAVAPGREEEEHRTEEEDDDRHGDVVRNPAV